MHSGALARSGGHMNPAVTLGLLLSNKISLMRAVCYIIVQLLGGLLGVALCEAGMLAVVTRDCVSSIAASVNMAVWNP